jgi:tRNA threonylcarbamoyl adenosine modification protein YeaZ
MRLLAIDTALAACAAAVLETGHGIVASESVPMVRGHAEALVPLVARVMKQADVTFSELDRIVVTTGPGSFTGVRVGLAAARGFGVATGLPVVGVSTLPVYAAPYLAAANTNRPVIAAIDARHAHVYVQVFGAGGQTLVSPRLAPLSEAIRAASGASACLVGSAAQAVADGLPSTAPAPYVVDARPAPDILWVAQIGAVTPEPDAAPHPQYLRAPDAQPQNAAQLPRR